nr:hypothetical protein [Tanacetum cinerariifolium]
MIVAQQDDDIADEGAASVAVDDVFAADEPTIPLQKTKEQLEEEDSKALKRKTESQAEKAAKKQKLDEEVEALRRHLQIVPNDEDDVYTEATPLARKVLEGNSMKEMYNALGLKAYLMARVLQQESAKKQKTSEEVPEEAMSPEEVPEEKVKEMIQLVPIEEVYVEALQVKHPIIDRKERLEPTMEIGEGDSQQQTTYK